MGPAGLEPAINAFHMPKQCKGTVIATRPWARIEAVFGWCLLNFWKSYT